MLLKIEKADQLKPKPDDNKLGFGSFFTDHMFNMDYSPDKGWYNPRIEPYGSIALDPATMVLHYGQGVFEGLKALNGSTGKSVSLGVTPMLRQQVTLFPSGKLTARYLSIPEQLVKVTFYRDEKRRSFVGKYSAVSSRRSCLLRRFRPVNEHAVPWIEP